MDVLLGIDTAATLLPGCLYIDAIKELHFHLCAIRMLVTQTRGAIENALDVTVEKIGLNQEGASAASVPRPGPAPHIWISDFAVPIDVKAKFVNDVSRLENVPENEKDYHPNTNNQVLNLLHPSLYCGVSKTTRIPPWSCRDDCFESPAHQMRTIMFRTTDKTLDTERITFQWLPSEVDVSPSGDDIKFQSYINNLHPIKHERLYESIESIFTRFVPMFDRVLSTLPSCEVDGKATVDASGDPYAAYYKNLSYSSKPRDPTLMPPGVIGSEIGRFSLKGSSCQVIVKIAEIQLTADKPTYNGGSWHVEGTDAERIIATGLYYFGSENITESRLSFRLWVSPPYYEQNDNVGVGLTYGLHDGDVLAQQYTSMTAMEDRCVVFPNIYQHKVEPFELADKSKSGVRKILAFFLVDPTHGPIASTAVVPPQQQTWIDEEFDLWMRNMSFPDVIVDRIRDLSREGMTHEEALKNRLQLIKECGPFEEYCVEGNHFTLCEH